LPDRLEEVDLSPMDMGQLNHSLDELTAKYFVERVKNNEQAMGTLLENIFNLFASTIPPDVFNPIFQLCNDIIVGIDVQDGFLKKKSLKNLRRDFVGSNIDDFEVDDTFLDARGPENLGELIEWLRTGVGS
jgi:hypothetical protein